MDYTEVKVYSDGSHYIGIPHTTRNCKRKPSPPEETIVVKDEPVQETPLNDTASSVETPQPAPDNTTPKGRLLTRKELFEELYRKSFDMKKWERFQYILQIMLPYFDSETTARYFVQDNIARKKRNIACRRVRLSLKMNLQEFNYFVTFTYSDEKHTEESFKHKLRGCLKMMVHRKGWKYIGAWERGEKDRLHFHGIFYIPEGKMVGELYKTTDYDTRSHRRRTILQNSYFVEKFGRTDFSPIVTKTDLGDAMKYMVKYMEKYGGKIVYSQGLPQYFISDIAEEDIVCNIGVGERKLLLFDNFTCYDQGEVMGQVSKETIAKMRKSN